MSARAKTGREESMALTRIGLLGGIVPDEADRALVHRVIFDELVHGVVRDESRAAYLDVVARLSAGGVDAVVLGCTEIGLLLRDGDAAVPLLDTTRLHCETLTDI